MLLQPGIRPVPNSPDYRLVGKLGAGAFGEVWHAHGPGGLDVALKFIPMSSETRGLELRSLEVMKSKRHPNLVSLFGAWHKDNCLILAMELCDCTLLDRLAEALDRKLPGIPPDELLNHMRDAASGLDYLNAEQVQHRDVKPANLLLLGNGVKVADFGLAKVLEQTVGSNTGAGTLAYTAPECFKGQLTQQSDQYSLAVTYYHLRSGHLPFTGNQAEIVYGHLMTEPDLSGLPPAERPILARALAKEPGKRWPSCIAFFGELNTAHIVAKGDSLSGPASRETAEKAKYHFGQDLLCKKDYDKAIADYTEAIRLDPKYTFAFYIRGLAWSAKKDYDKAIKDFDEVIRLDPREAYGVIYGHFAARQAKDDAAAKRFLKDSAAKLDDAAWPYPVIRCLRGEIDEPALVKLADDDDKRTEAHCYLGLDHALKGRQDEALAHFRWVKEHGNPSFIPYKIALAELERLTPDQREKSSRQAPDASNAGWRERIRNVLLTEDGEHWIWNVLLAALILIPLATSVLAQQVGVREDNASVISGSAFMLTFGGIVGLLIWRGLMKKST